MNSLSFWGKHLVENWKDVPPGTSAMIRDSTSEEEHHTNKHDSSSVMIWDYVVALKSVIHEGNSLAFRACLYMT